MNKLYYGDCLTILQGMPQKSVDLIYLDPPFNSKRNYHAIYKDETGKPLPDQIEAFCDQWELDAERERVVRQMPVLMREAGIDDQTAEFWRTWMDALRHTQPGLLAYLVYMVERLIWMRLLLKPTGAIYLHCDPTASHYIKIMMDSILGHKNFRNEIIWHYGLGAFNSRKHFPRKHDTLLFYSRTDNHPFQVQRGEVTDAMLQKYRHIDDDGRRYMNSYGKKYYLKGGKPYDSVWEIPALAPRSRERMGFATQKPVALLDRIIRASCPPDGLVLDPFCGCATTLEAAHRLGRRWIGIDIAIHAIKRVAKVRLEERLELVEGRDFEIEGMPRNLEGAIDLHRRDPYHFQKWAVEQVDGFVTSKRTADGGIDGRLYFEMPGEEQLQSMVIEVKGGRSVNISHVRALGNVLRTSGAQMAGMIVMHPLGDRQRRNFEQEMAKAGDLEVATVPQTEYYPRMQLLTVQEILDGKRFITPGARGQRTSPQFGLNMPEGTQSP